jgi:hypothetical protein
VISNEILVDCIGWIHELEELDAAYDDIEDILY